MQEKRYTLTADFEVQGRLAYLSHQETLTMFQRALVRAQLPLAFSGGFNPRPKLSIPLARSVGTQSSVERICAGLSTDTSFDMQHARQALQSQLPDGCRVVDVQCLEGKQVFHAAGVGYVFMLNAAADESLQQHWQACQNALAAGGCIEIQRYRAKKRKWEAFDLSPFVQQLEFGENCVEVRCHVSQAGTVRVDELMGWLNLTISMLSEPVCRTAIQWRSDAHNLKGV
ncbi:MAG: TIGR03936 family radical SAM-associated protein [Planctomycetota bacterium]|jgi:radical SAM-linked protein